MLCVCGGDPKPQTAALFGVQRLHAKGTDTWQKFPGPPAA